MATQIVDPGLKPSIIVRPVSDRLSSRGRPNFLLHLLEEFGLSDRVSIVEQAGPDNRDLHLPIPVKLQSHLARGPDAPSAYDLVPEAMLQEALSSGTSLQLWMLLEPFVPIRHTGFLNDGVEQHRIPDGSAVLINNNLRSERWARAHPEAMAGVRMVGFPGCYWILKAHNQIDIERDVSFRDRVQRARATLETGRPKKLVSFNGRLRPPRVNVLLWLLKHGHFPDCLLSLQGYSAKSGPGQIDGLKRAVLRYASDVEDRFDELLAMLPLNLDVSLAGYEQDRRWYDVLPWTSQNPDLYDQAYMSVSIDTYPDDVDTLFLSPIAFKSFMNLSPFVYFGNHGALAEMRRLGFQTFSPFIDESYDEIENPIERMNAALRALDGALKSDLRYAYRALWPRLEHNCRHIYRAGDDFKEELWADLKRAF